MGGFDDGLEDEGEPRLGPLLPPDDRVWRHPSEVGQAALVGGRVGRQREQRTWAVALLAGLVGGVLATAIALAAGQASRHPPVERVIERVAGPEPGGSPQEAVMAASQGIRPSLVQLVVKRHDGEAHGSGIVLRDDGHVLTSQHLTEGTSQVTVITGDSRRLRGSLVGGDADTDVAVVKVNAAGLSPAPLGTATTLRPGEECIAVGAPLGLANEPAVSVGVVSAIGRSVQGEGRRLYDLIQTDTTLSSDAAGGPLLDRTGAVVGVTTAVGGQSQEGGITFAVPIDIARAVADELISQGKATHVWLGVEGSDLDQAAADRLGLDGGAMVGRVIEGSPAEAAGLAAGDVIIAFDDRPVRTMASLVVALRAGRVGHVASLTYLRDTTPTTTKVTLRERPED